MSVLEERRQAARGAHLCTPCLACLDAAIMAATRVRITPEIMLAFIAESTEVNGGDLTKPFRAAFDAAGFEVVE